MDDIPNRIPVVDPQSPKLVIYLGSVPGVGKTHRMLIDAVAEQESGRRVAVAWVETKGRPELDALLARLPRIAPATFRIDEAEFADLDYEAACSSDAEILLIDELAHTNPRGAAHAKRWQDVAALRAAGKTVYTTCNIAHVESVAAIAERVVGSPIREIVPTHLLVQAERVIAIDTPVDQLHARLDRGAIVRPEDIDRARSGILRPQSIKALRELLFRVIDDVTEPELIASRSSRALALVTEHIDPLPFLRRVAAIADALNLAFDVTSLNADEEQVAEALGEVSATRVPFDPAIAKGDLSSVQAAFFALPMSRLAERILREPIERSLLIADPVRSPHAPSGETSPSLRTLREQTGAGKLTIYFGSVAGSGKTYGMLERAHQMLRERIDVVAAVIETHGRSETGQKAVGIPTIPLLPNGELDLDAILARVPQTVLVDEFAHSNGPHARHAKRYEDVAYLLAAGIDVITTVNVQHFEGVVPAVERLTATRVRETIPDEMLELAQDVVFIDVSSDVLQQRLRDGKIYPQRQIETALANFFRYEHLVALRELAVRELTRARSVRRFGRPFIRIILGVAPRERESRLIEHIARLAKRIQVKLWVFCITEDPLDPAIHEHLTRAASAVDAIFFTRQAKQPAEALTALAGNDDLLAIESPRTRRGLFGRTSFASRMLKAGARELLVIAPLS